MEDHQSLQATATMLAGAQAPVGGDTQARIMRAIAQSTGQLARRDIARSLKLSPATLSKAVTYLTAKKFIREGAAQSSGPGRPTVPLSWASTYVLIGVRIVDRDDLPAEAIGTITYLDGTTLPGLDKGNRHQFSEKARAQFSVLVDEMVTLIAQLADSVESRDPQVTVLGCGVAMGGHVDHGVIRMSYNTGWGAPRVWSDRESYALRDRLSDRLPFDVVLDNDVNALAVHAMLTSAPADSYGVVAVLRDGIGGALVLDGDMWRGPRGLVGEIGHQAAGDVVIGAQSEPGAELPRCRCGVAGHAEAFAAPRAIAQRAGVPDFDELAGTKNTDPAVVELFRQGGRALGRGLVTMILMANPDLILVHLPPALDARNTAYPGAHYRQGILDEVAQCFSTGRDTVLKIKPLGEDQLEERGAAAAAMLVLGRLIDMVAFEGDQRRAAAAAER